jgi:tRNA-dihydrouridine synthase A
MARLSVAPMMDWTDRHCRMFHRMMSRQTHLYTEMITAAAIVHGDRGRLLMYDPVEHPVALQIGGSDPALVGQATRIGVEFGYDEVNLNVGCPSDRVQSGAFGAVLMETPALVRDCVGAMLDAAGGAKVSVKCRIGVDEQEPHEVLPAFLEVVSSSGVRDFTIHARKAWLKGLSPKENRDIPPLDYPLVMQMKRDFPHLSIGINGGIESLAQAHDFLDAGLDGVMIGRAAYHNPAEILMGADAVIFDARPPIDDRHATVFAMQSYIEAEVAKGTKLSAITRHMLGLFNGLPGARAWRRHLSENAHAPDAGFGIVAEALSFVSTGQTRQSA